MVSRQEGTSVISPIAWMRKPRLTETQGAGRRLRAGGGASPLCRVCNCVTSPKESPEWPKSAVSSLGIPGCHDWRVLGSYLCSSK